MKILLNGQQMKNADQYTIQELKVPSLVLMENAANACVKELEDQKISLDKVCIVCGSGNNGGDGFAIGRILLLKKINVQIVFLGKEERCTCETKVQMEKYREIGGTISTHFTEDSYTVIIDAIFGVGLSRNVEGNYAEIIDQMNKIDCFKLAVDIPSGIHSDTGKVMGTAFQADLTVTFQYEKMGLRLYPGQLYAGDIKACEIGISQDGLPAKEEYCVAYERKDLLHSMPARNPDSHKGSYGKTLIIGGSKGMAGAAYFNALAAYRTGAGLVQIYTHETNRGILQQLIPEAILSTYESFDETQLEELLDWADVVCIGSGMGTGSVSERIVEKTVRYVKVPCVVDADALNLVSAHQEWLKALNGKRFVFTPHMKEMARIMQTSIAEIKERKLDIIREFTDRYSVSLVLKDARTITKQNKESFCMNLSGNASMAKGGSGDVLTGIIGGLISQGKPVYEGTCLGVFLHGLAGDAAKKAWGSYSPIARDLIDGIGTVLKEIEVN